MVQLSHMYMITGKSMALAIWIFVYKEWLCFLKYCPGNNTGVGTTPSSRRSSQPGVWTYISCNSCIAADSLLLGHWGSPWQICVYVLVWQLCPTFCNLMDCSAPGSSVYGISQARILDWIAILVVVVHGIGSWGSWTLECGLSSCDTEHQFPCSMWDFPRPGIRDWTRVPCVSRQILNHWTSMEVPNLYS